LTSKNAYFTKAASEEKKAENFDIFQKVHDTIMAEFVQHIEELCRDWMESDAGRAWQREISKRKYVLWTFILLTCRKSKKGTNHFLITAKSLETVIIDGIHNGLKLDGSCTWKFWQSCLEIFDCTQVNEVSNSINISNIRISFGRHLIMRNLINRAPGCGA
jgi:hypothetical protein